MLISSIAYKYINYLPKHKIHCLKISVKSGLLPREVFVGTNDDFYVKCLAECLAEPKVVPSSFFPPFSYSL